MQYAVHVVRRTRCSDAGEFRAGAAVFVALLVLAGAAAAFYAAGSPEDLSELPSLFTEDTGSATADETGVADATVQGGLDDVTDRVGDVALYLVDVDGQLCVEVVAGDSRTVTCDVGKLSELASPSE